MKKIFAAVSLGLLVAAGLALGAGVLENDAIDGIKLSDDIKLVTDKYGEAEKKVKGEYEEATGCQNWTYKYAAKGLDFRTCEVKGMEGQAVTDIMVYGKATAKTAKGIGIGSGKEEVEKIYGPLSKSDPQYDVGLIDEECSCSINF